MVSFHVLYFWQRGIRKLELERTKFGKFASQGTNNSRSWKFKFERVLDRKIYLHGRHIFFFFFSVITLSNILSFEIFDFRYCSSKHETRPFAGYAVPFLTDLHRKFHYIFEMESIFAEEKSRCKPLEVSKDPLFEDCARPPFQKPFPHSSFKSIRLNGYRFSLFLFLRKYRLATRNYSTRLISFFPSRSVSKMLCNGINNVLILWGESNFTRSFRERKAIWMQLALKTSWKS